MLAPRRTLLCSNPKRPCQRWFQASFEPTSIGGIRYYVTEFRPSNRPGWARSDDVAHRSEEVQMLKVDRIIALESARAIETEARRLRLSVQRGEIPDPPTDAFYNRVQCLRYALGDPARRVGPCKS